MTLQELRKRAGFTQVFVAQKMGVTQGTVYQWEKGLISLHITKVSQLAALYDVGIDEIINACGALKVQKQSSA